jgi:hypothetical protein
MSKSQQPPQAQPMPGQTIRLGDMTIGQPLPPASIDSGNPKAPSPMDTLMALGGLRGVHNAATLYKALQGAPPVGIPQIAPLMPMQLAGPAAYGQGTAPQYVPVNFPFSR